MQKPWFPEPIEQDNSCAERSESTTEWLSRSTNNRAIACREFLNHNISRLPYASQEGFVQALSSRWSSAFFELIVARTLQGLGASIVIEEESHSGRRPDFTASFADSQVVVEAVSPIYNSSIGNLAKQRMPLLAFIERNKPNDWIIGVVSLPSIGHDDSKREFKRVVLKMFADLRDLNVEPGEMIEIGQEVSGGVIGMSCVRRSSDLTRIAFEPPYTTFSNVSDRIRNSVKRKRKQVRGSDSPVILAVEGDSLLGTWEDYDKALFGYTFERFVGSVSVARGFSADGILSLAPSSESNHGSPTINAVLAFLSVGFREAPSPILYRHPRFNGELPQAFGQFEERYLNPEEGIVRIPPQRDVNYWRDVRFVPMSV